jgi:hypothetical protein
MVIQESDDNLLLSCEAHGKETYFNIKKMEKKKNTFDAAMFTFGLRERNKQRRCGLRS